jgi:uncharacterized membrane protein YfcA
MLTYIITFFAVFATDILYVYFIKAVQNNRPMQASFWSVLVTLTATITVISYTEDHWAIIPALIGAAVGTYAGMALRRRQQVE